MSETKHTPGPWKCEPHSAGTGRGSEHDWTILGDPFEDWDDDNRPTVGYIVVAKALGNATSGDIPEANARLIAAAPELLSALQWSIQHSPYQGDPEETDFLRAARAAIAKATGK